LKPKLRTKKNAPRRSRSIAKKLMDSKVSPGSSRLVNDGMRHK
jgi:hypothetical protein